MLTCLDNLLITSLHLQDRIALFHLMIAQSHADRRTDGHVDVLTYRHGDTQMYKHEDMQTQPCRQTYRHTDKHTYKHTDLWTYGQEACGHNCRCADMQRSIRAHIHTCMHTNRYTQILVTHGHIDASHGKVAAETPPCKIYMNNLLGWLRLGWLKLP